MKKAQKKKRRARTLSKQKGALTKLDLSKAGDGGAANGTDGYGGTSQAGRAAKSDGSLELSLRAVRLAAGRTQNDVSRATGIAQGDVSRLEQRANLDDCQISTLRRYVVALGGRLDVRAVFAEGRMVALTGWEDPDL